MIHDRSAHIRWHLCVQEDSAERINQVPGVRRCDSSLRREHSKRASSAQIDGEIGDPVVHQVVSQGEPQNGIRSVLLGELRRVRCRARDHVVRRKEV